MTEFNFYKYYENIDKIKIYSDEIQKYFESNFNIIINSIDFDRNQNIILYIEDMKNESLFIILEKKLINNIEHLNNVKIKKTKIILTFNSAEIEIC